MTLTFPRPLPVSGAASQEFEPARVDYLSPETGGRLGGVSAGFPLWKGVWTLSQTGLLATSEEWRALISSLRGPQRTFYGRDYARPRPLSLPNGFTGLTRAGGGAFDGTALTWSLNGTRDEITLTGLSAGLALSIGDYGMFRWATSGQARRSLHRAVAASTASGAGVAVMTVEPPVPTLVPVGAVFDLSEPACIMKSVPGETRIGSMGRNKRVDGQLVGLQELLP